MRPAAAGSRDCETPGACVNCLRVSALGADLTDEEVRVLGDVAEISWLAKDDHLHAIASGELEIFRAGEGGGEVCLQRLGPGEFTGELAFIEGPRKKGPATEAAGPVVSVFGSAIV